MAGGAVNRKKQGNSPKSLEIQGKTEQEPSVNDYRIAKTRTKAEIKRLTVAFLRLFAHVLGEEMRRAALGRKLSSAIHFNVGRVGGGTPRFAAAGGKRRQA
jgi:hypothetical protein